MLAWYYLPSVALSLHTQTTNPINRTKKNNCMSLILCHIYNGLAD